MSRILYTGDTHPVSIKIQTDNEPVPVPSDADVTAALVSATTGDMLAGPWAVVEADGGNWSEGTLICWIDGGDTAALSPQMVRLEVQIISDSVVPGHPQEILTRQSLETINLRKGALPNP